jgi:glucose-6-phosphate isomerase
MLFKQNYQNIAKEILNEIEEGKLLPLSIIYNAKYYAELIKKAEEIKAKYKKVFVIGMGGSFLGAKTITEGLGLSQKIEFLYYIEEDILQSKLQEITQEDLCIFISKSGETVEVLYILEKILKTNFKNIIGITAQPEGKLSQICLQNGFEILKHEEVSGRFSFLTSVGILPSLIAGLNLEEFLNGVKMAINTTLVKQDENFYKYLNSQLFNKNLNLNILMPYSLKLKTLTNWFCQLYAESLNRKEFKIMPYPSIGTVDQHSVLEGYLQNPEDKMITFIARKDQSLLYKEYILTKTICMQRGIEVRTFEFAEIGSKELGFLMAYFAIEVILIARVLGINPFNQEMVEKRKNLKIHL